MKRDIKTVAGARTRVRVELVRDEGDVSEVELVLRVAVGDGIELRYACGFFELPALAEGRYDYELLLDGSPLVRGAVSVRASVCCEGALVDGVLWVDLPCWFFVVSRGPRGEVGPRGFSAYELAGQHGYAGTEAEWVDAFNGAQDAVAAAKESATNAQSAATTAETAKTNAQSAATTAETAKTDAQSAATTAETAKTDAQTAASTAETAKTDAQTAASTAETAKTDAQTAASTAETAKTDAQTAASTAETAKTDAQSAATAAETAKADAQNAASAAAKSATDAAATLAGAAQVDANNEFTATNMFTGALVANGSLLYGQQELGDLLSYPGAAWLLENGLHPASALAKSWDEWVAINPDWDSLEHVIFYAPLITETLQLSDSPTTIPSNKKCTFISPANVNYTGSSYFLRRHLKYFTLKSGDNADVYNCYYMIDCAFYAPNATKLTSALNAVGWNTTRLSLSVYVPSVTTINNGNNINDTFHRLGLLASFYIYAPNLVTSFSFSRLTNSGKGQTCAILQALIAGIGTPETLQTITTITPSDGDEVQTVDGVEKTKKDILREAAATKNWKFIIPAKDAEGNNITIDL